MKKRLVKVVVGIMMIGILVGCGKKEIATSYDTQANAEEDIVDIQEEEVAKNQEIKEDDFEFEEKEGEVVLIRYNGSATSVTIPEHKDGKPITIVGEFSFSQNETVEEVIIPNSIIEIEKGAFKMCSSLKKVVLGENVSIIGEEAFFMDNLITEINIPNSTTEIGELAFGNINVANITIPSNLKIIERGVFSANGSLESAVIPGNINNISEIAFSACENLKEVEIQEGVEKIGENAFGDCTILEKVVIPASVIEINEYAFIYSGNNLVIIAPTGSYAEQYAAEQEITFQAQ